MHLRRKTRLAENMRFYKECLENAEQIQKLITFFDIMRN